MNLNSDAVLTGKPSDPYHLELWNMDQNSSIPRVQDAWAPNIAAAMELFSTNAQKDHHFRLVLWYHPTESRGHRVLISKFDREGIVPNPDGEYEPSKKDLGFEIGHLLANRDDNIGDAFVSFLRNSAENTAPSFDGLADLLAGIFDGNG